MPELPEVETVVRTVAAHLTGRTILSAEFTSRHVTPGNRSALSKHLTGRKIESVRRRGKFILVTLDEGAFSIHLGMTGSLLVAGKPAQHTHAVFTLDDGLLLYNDSRQFGKIEWNPGRVHRLGPEPLEISLEDFRARLRRKARIKPLLLNQTFLAGLGNIYADESLFASGIHPLTSAAKLSAPRAAKLHQAIREILTAAIEAGGSSISDYVDAEGRKGWFQVSHRVYGREGEACVKCGTPIKRIVVAQRSSHYCPKCQKR
ncbi:MAG TPA: bifunctional DNA-formamidopyrimidine glycosylase/DNA-(apurinic or apyrimidinic site) lyase [Bryobacteraceae bacterium]